MKRISLPKIGIRPVIDGRRMGVRESLEEQTMNMAKATAALISEKLRHASGAQIECVIADTCIAGMAESAACEEKFSSQNVGVTITVTLAGATAAKPSTWIRRARRPSGDLTARSAPAPSIWPRAGRPQSERIPAFSIYGHDVRMPTTPPSRPTLRKNCCVLPALAVASMKGKSSLRGWVSMGIAGSIVDHNFFESRLGMKVQAVDMTELRRRIDQKIYDEVELEMALALGG